MANSKDILLHNSIKMLRDAILPKHKKQIQFKEQNIIQFSLSLHRNLNILYVSIWR